MKFVIVVLAIVLLAWLLFGRGRRGESDAPPRRRAPKPTAVIEGMVRCAHCGVHLPASEALATGALHYCSDAHRQRGPQAPPS